LVGLSRSPKGFKDRWRKHKNKLKNLSHENPILQNYFDKYGEEKFLFVLLEECFPTDDLDSKEIEWSTRLKSMKSDNGFNIRSPGNQIVMTQEMKDKISKTLMGHYVSLETRKKIAKILTGKKATLETKNKLSERIRSNPKRMEWAKNLSQKNAKDFILLNPDKELINIHNLRKFCRENNLNVVHIYSVINGERSHYKGWTTPENAFSKIIYKFLSPNNILYETNNLIQFCKENKLQTAHITRLWNGKINQLKGWKKYE